MAGTETNLSALRAGFDDVRGLSLTLPRSGGVERASGEGVRGASGCLAAAAFTGSGRPQAPNELSPPHFRLGPFFFILGHLLIP